MQRVIYYKISNVLDIRIDFQLPHEITNSNSTYTSVSTPICTTVGLIFIAFMLGSGGRKNT